MIVDTDLNAPTNLWTLRKIFPTYKLKNKVKIPAELINVLSDENVVQGPFPWTQISSLLKFFLMQGEVSNKLRKVLAYNKN